VQETLLVAKFLLPCDEKIRANDTNTLLVTITQ